MKKIFVVLLLMSLTSIFAQESAKVHGKIYEDESAIEMFGSVVKSNKTDVSVAELEKVIQKLKSAGETEFLTGYYDGKLVLCDLDRNNLIQNGAVEIPKDFVLMKYSVSLLEKLIKLDGGTNKYVHFSQHEGKSALDGVTNVVAMTLGSYVLEMGSPCPPVCLFNEMSNCPAVCSIVVIYLDITFSSNMVNYYYG